MEVPDQLCCGGPPTNLVDSMLEKKRRSLTFFPKEPTDYRRFKKADHRLGLRSGMDFVSWITIAT